MGANQRFSRPELTAQEVVPLTAAKVALYGVPLRCSVRFMTTGTISSGVNPSNQSRLAKSGGTDFDFLFGTWRVHHRKLKHRLAGDTDWIQFEGEMTCWPTLGGLGNVDDNLLGDPSGAYRAMSLRCYDLQAGRWSIWWVDGRSIRVDPPVHGQFQNGLGTFQGEDTFAGKPILCGFSGPTSRRSRPGGNRRSPTTAVRTGNQTGS